MILVIDNYDSFTYNLVQLVGQHTSDFRVARNDALTVEQVAALRPERIIISPGPGRPEHAGICVSLLQTVSTSIPTLGVCLGHQAIGYAFGGRVIHAPTLMHGKISAIAHGGDGIYTGLANPFEATRYHSLVISPDDFPSQLAITARTSDGVIMGVRHKEYPIEGIQFHPESVLTTAGPALLANWITHGKARR